MLQDHHRFALRALGQHVPARLPERKPANQIDHRLQALLSFQQHYIASTVAAQVIGTSGSELSRLLYIDKGSLDGLKPDQPVITPDGIVGKLRDVFPHTSQVLEISWLRDLRIWADGRAGHRQISP